MKKIFIPIFLSAVVIVFSASRLEAQTDTFTPTPTFTPTRTPTFTSTPTVNCSAMTTVNFYGDLSSTQAADQPGGVLQLGTAAAPNLPIALPGATFNGAKLDKAAWNSGQALFQILDLAELSDASPNALPNHAQANVTGGTACLSAQSAGVSTYAWNQLPILPPACTAVKNVIDSVGNARQITVQFYQVNDLGTAVPPVNPNPPHQAAYAWYAFDTTGAQPPSNANLIGGPGITEDNNSAVCSNDRGISGSWYFGDLIVFNTDGSLASEGGTSVIAGIFQQSKARVYLRPLTGGVLTIELNFGTAGMLGFGQRNGLTGDASPHSCNNASASTMTPTNTLSPTPTFTPTPTGTTTPPLTPTFTYTPTYSPTITPTPTNTLFVPTNTFTPTPNPTCDYIFGKFSGSSQAAVPGELLANQYLINGNLLYLACEVTQAGQIQLAIYDHDFPNFKPGTLVAQSGVSNVVPGTNYFYDFAGTITAGGVYWLAFRTFGGTQLAYDIGGVGEYGVSVGGGPLPVTFPSGTAGSRDWTIWGHSDLCSGSPSPTYTPTITPTPAATVIFTYINNEAACAAAFGCSITVVQQCRALNLDILTCYMIMRICALCGGCTPADIMLLRLTMGWDEICGYYGIEWATFVADLQTRMQPLAPEKVTPNQIMRAAANDPAQFPISNPAPGMPDTLAQSTPFLEACPSCP